MRKIFLSLWLAGVFVALSTGCLRAEAPAATPIVTAKQKALTALADGLISAPDDAARRTLLAGAKGRFKREEIRFAFHDKIGPVIYAGNFSRAEDLLRFERAWNKENHDERGLMLVEWSFANIDGMRGNNQAARARFEKCVQFFTARKEPEREAGATLGLSIVHLQLGDYRRAQNGFRRAHAIYQKLGNKEGIINTLNSLGSVYNDQALRDHALDMWQRALVLVGDDPSWQNLLFYNLSTVHAARDEDAQALDYIQRALALAEKTGEKPRIAICQDGMGDLLFKADRLDEAEAHYRTALEVGREMDDKRRQFSATSSLAAVAWRRGKTHWEDALALATQASILARSTDEPAHRWEADTLLGKIQRGRGETGPARVAFERAIACIEDLRGRLSGGDEGAAVFLEDKVEPYQEMVGLLADAGQTRAALEMAERGKARVLLEFLRSAKTDPQALLDKQEGARLKAVEQEITILNQQIARAEADSKEMPGLQARLHQARLDRERAEADVLAAHPQLRLRGGVDVAAALSPDKLADWFGDGKKALLEYAVTETETFLFVVRGAQPVSPSAVASTTAHLDSGKDSNVQIFRLPVGRKDLLTRTRNFRRMLAERDLDWRGAARQLGTDLLAVSRPAWDDAEELVIVPDEVLWELPFQALIVGPKLPADGRESTLLEQLPVNFAPSLAFLARLDQTGSNAQADNRPARMLAFGAPASGKAAAGPAIGPVLMDDEARPLPEAERQLRALEKLYGRDGSQVYSGVEAREDTFKRLAGDFDILHFATHGFFNDGAPLYSRLLLNQRDLAPDEDGFLEAWELLGLKLHARLAVLSACETGRGHIGAGEGVFGLSWALLMAGCPEVIVSQWKVDSASTTEIMLGLHQRLRGGKPPETALREASLELMKNPAFQHPFYWAPFVTVGAAGG